ncbi:C-type lectin domain family 4 member A-like [Peromyscus leucopus]|uniref:C-type lectin domain family 4 member A-like n=1 Tax=Peromyscus leucopus TaxID=10041 RepID=UPI0010A1EDE7|nr:C-type lectin domain family 4 member A-like [Peromyscus leucopus]
MTIYRCVWFSHTTSFRQEMRCVSEITYAEVKFKNESNSSGTYSDSATAPKMKPTPHLSKPGGCPSLLFISLMTLFLLLAISFLVAFIWKFQNHIAVVCGYRS